MATPGMTTASGTSSPIAVNGVYDKSRVGLFTEGCGVGIGSSSARATCRRALETYECNAIHDVIHTFGGRISAMKLIGRRSGEDR